MVSKKEEIWEWIYINDEKTCYEISNKNNYRSTYGRKKENLGIHIDNGGYRIAFIYHNGKRYSKRFHRLVFNAFKENPHNYPYINHIDGIKLHNEPENLEPCTASMNTKHAYDIGIKKPIKGGNHYKAKKVSRLLNGEVIKVYDSIMDAELDGFGNRGIGRALKTGIKHHGSHWKYLDKEPINV